MPSSLAGFGSRSRWFVRMWEAILDRRQRIDVIESVPQGRDRCLFAVHIPQELL